MEGMATSGLGKHVPSGAVVGVLPSREKKLKFAAEEASPEVDSRLRAMIENLLHLSPYSMCITDMQKEDEPIVYANEMFCKWTEYPEEYIVGRNCRFLQGPETDPATVKGMRDAIRAGKEFRGIIRNYSRTGIHLWNNLVMTPVKNADGFVTHYTGIQIFSHEPPNTINTPAPPKDAIFNPLSQHVKMWQEKLAKKAAGESEEALLSALEATQKSMSPKIMPRAGSGFKDPNREDPLSSPKHSSKVIDPKFANSPYLQKPASPPRKHSGGASSKPSTSPKKRTVEELAKQAPPNPTLQVNQDLPVFTPRRRNSTARRQGGHCQIVPDRDVWLELLCRSLSPENVPMLPEQPEGPVERSRAMSNTDFAAAREEGRAQVVH